MLVRIRRRQIGWGPDWEQKFPQAKEAVGVLFRDESFRWNARRFLKHPWIALARERVSKAKIELVLSKAFKSCRPPPKSCSR